MIIGRKNVNINILIKSLQMESNVIKNNIACIMSGSRIGKVDVKRKKRMEHLKNVIKNQENYISLFEYVRNIAKNL